MTEVEKFYNSILQDVKSEAQTVEDGGMYEPLFTQYAIDLLSETNETENACEAYDEKWLGTQKQLKINGYAISDNYETIDLFISLFYDDENIPRVPKADIDQAEKRITNFFKTAFYKDFVNQIEESSPIFQFAYSLAEYKDLRENLVRVNAIILTNGEYKGDFPGSIVIDGINIYYRVVDVNYMYKISEHARIPIELDFENFEGEQFEIPCLTVNTHNSDYKSYIAILPGNCLAKLYERYGARLLEQNVRSFLQFGRKGVNAGIRDTIRNEPQMFLAFNNGIAATADHIELDNENRHIKKISNLQIVNGGQTTASIYNTAKKEKIDISKIFVQVKFSIIENSDQYSDIVSRISRYANTQNKVKEEDFSANNPTLVAFEKLSRYILSPITARNNLQTCWFFERARGQYKTLRSREGTTKAKQLAFDKKYPKNQMLTKVELAKYINAYQEIYDAKKLVIGPFCVVGGDTKNFNCYVNYNLPDKINNVYFEDTIAKSIIYETAKKRYGVFPNSIGRERQTVVPYTLTLLNIVTKNKLDLYKIWKNQQISNELSDFIFDLMKQVNQFIWDNSPSTNYNEEGKKESLWILVRDNIVLNYEIDDIKSDLIDEKNPPKRNIEIDITEEELTKNRETVKSIPAALWNEIGNWGKDSGYFDIAKQNIVSNIAYKLRQNKPLADEECKKGVELLDIVATRNDQLLQESEKYAGKWVQMKKVKITDDDKNTLILEQIRKMIIFNVERNILSKEESDFLFDLINGKQERDYDADEMIVKCLQKLIKKGFVV